MAWRSTPNVPSTAPSGKPRSSSTGPCSMCNSRYAAAFFNSLPLSFTRSKSMPTFFSASGSRMPSLSTRPRASFMSRLPEQADEPNKLLPNRAPSSSAQSTRRTVTGGLPLYCELMRRRISTPASTLRQPSSQPPFGTESMWPPMSRAFFRFAAQRGPGVARGVVVDFHRQPFEFFCAATRGPSATSA